ncbi:hypothetical protein BLOT_015369 [Blomia tropicalis]|nr:hypothetical protein BLOT_015369 [Blomia tropicalis]
MEQKESICFDVVSAVHPAVKQAERDIRMRFPCMRTSGFNFMACRYLNSIEFEPTRRTLIVKDVNEFKRKYNKDPFEIPNVVIHVLNHNKQDDHRKNAY